VTFEIGQIGQLFTAYADLLERVQKRTPDLVEATAIASVLHSFYNGLENIFLSIVKGLDQKVPHGPQWHRDLLVQMSQRVENRDVVVSTELAQKLADYPGFRHFYRHSYSFLLEWEEMKKLAIPLREVWAQVKEELDRFLENLNPPQESRQGS